jgi:hypothetical protein
MPDTIGKVIDLWESHGLEAYKQGYRSMTGWDMALRIRWSKWYYIYRKVEERARNYYNGTSIQACKLAAASIDEDRIDRGLSVPQLYEEWKSNDPSTKRRRASTGENPRRNQGGRGRRRAD